MPIAPVLVEGACEGKVCKSYSRPKTLNRLPSAELSSEKTAVRGFDLELSELLIDIW